MLDLDLIRIDGGTQSREKLNEETVAEYAEAYRSGVKFPPVIVFFDGTDRWLADGFHRYFGAKSAGLTQILENITPGTKRDAVLYSLGANGKHGLNRTNADKRKSVLIALSDSEWSQLPHKEIAKICDVSREYVSRLAGEIEPSCDRSQDRTRTVERNGKTYQQDTSSIGKAAPASRPAVTAPAKVEPEAEAPLDYTEMDAARDQISDLQADLVVARMGDIPDDQKQQASEHIAGLQAEVNTLSATLKAVCLSRDSLLEENAQMKRQMQMQRKEIDRLKNNQ
jgi:hypothetical protein